MSCDYCGSESSSDFCSVDCKEKYEEHVLKGKKWGSLFLVLLLLPPVLLGILAAIYDWGPLEFFSVFFLIEGMVLILFPFATPETISAIGVKRSVRIVRGVGVICVTAGALIILSCLRS